MWRWTGWKWGGGEVGWGRVEGTTPLSTNLSKRRRGRKTPS